MSITCQYGNYTCQIMIFFTLASASITLARNWVFFAEWGNAAINTRLSYHRCASSKQSLQPTPPRLPFFPPKPRSACRFSIWPRSTCEPVRRLGFWEQILGSVSRNDGDGYENVSLKVKSRCFKNVTALIPSRSIRQMLAIFVWIWILKIFIKVQEKKTKVVVVCSRPPQNVKFGIFTSLSCSDGKEMYKIVWCTCKVVVLPN